MLRRLSANADGLRGCVCPGFPMCRDGEQPVPEGLPPKVVEVYQAVGKIMSRYSAGKVPKAFKLIPTLKNWEEVGCNVLPAR